MSLVGCHTCKGQKKVLGPGMMDVMCWTCEGRGVLTEAEKAKHVEKVAQSNDPEESKPDCKDKVQLTDEHFDLVNERTANAEKRETTVNTADAASIPEQAPKRRGRPKSESA